jgi:hypothetical protein
VFFGTGVIRRRQPATDELNTPHCALSEKVLAADNDADQRVLLAARHRSSPHPRVVSHPCVNSRQEQR